MKKSFNLFLFIFSAGIVTIIIQNRIFTSKNQELEAVKITVLGKHKLSSAPDFNFLKGISEKGDTLFFMYLSQKIYNLLKLDSTYWVELEPDCQINNWHSINRVL